MIYCFDDHFSIMKEYSALIIDDEISAFNTLNGMLQEYCPYIISIEKALNETDAIRLIEGIKPDIIFLDIEMPPFSNSIEMISNLSQRSCQIIVTSAYPQYEIDHLNTIQGIGYLIKPFSVDQLVSVVQKSIKIFQQQSGLKTLQL